MARAAGVGSAAIREAANAVVLFTGLPLATLNMILGARARSEPEVEAGIVVALVLGGPLLIRDWLARRHRSD